MEKHQAIASANRRYEQFVLNNRTTHFANINAAKEVWWLDLPLSKIASGVMEHINLLLFDHRKKELHHLRVPTSFLRENQDKLVTRPRKRTEEAISLELSAVNGQLFRDVRPGGTGVDFARFRQR